MMRQKELTFTREIHVEHEYVYCDPIKLREVFINILSNAYKYTNSGGKVHMLLEEVPSDREGYAMYRTTISDTGMGMAEDFLPHLFEEFSRENNTTDNKIEGTGLGMPIVKRLVELMEGTIEVRSKKGEGSTFIVTLPHKIAQRPDQTEQSTGEVDVESFKGKRILLAEDNELNAEIAIEILTEAGFEVERAEDGQVCADMLLQAQDFYYDVILMDVQMPHMNGYEATKTIRAMPDRAKADIPILAMTANAFEEDKRNALRAGMNGHLAKPVNVRDLYKALMGILGNQS
jgi:CheY-like chemotaxis protein